MDATFELTLADIAGATGGELIRGRPTYAVEEVVTDSRAAITSKSLFLAIEGDHFDGHDFIGQIRQKGACGAVVSRDWIAHTDARPLDDLAVIAVANTVDALQAIAAHWRGRFDTPVVGVTGSNGKTIVKDMLASILAQDRTVYRSPGSYNSQIGVALSLLGMHAEHDIAIIEAGISQTDEMQRLEAMIRPTIGVITNIGLAHAAGLGDLATTAAEKLKLFARFDSQPLIYPSQSNPLTNCRLPGSPTSFALADTADAPEADYAVERVTETATGYRFVIRFADDATHQFALDVPGRHNLSNAACAIATADHLGVSVDAIRQGLAAFELSPLRLEMHTTQDGITLINDAYSSDPVSARAALSVLDHYAGDHRAIAILGDMLDLGARSEAAHRQLGTFAAQSGVDRLVCYGGRAKLIGEAAAGAGLDEDHIVWVDAMETLHDMLEAELRAGDVVLFKASRNIGLERAAERLLESVAPARLRIDIDAIRDNYHALRRHLGGETGVIGVVKSFGYGNDATRVSQTLAREGVDALAVAYADEAIPLRARGLTVPILVTNALASEADKLVKYDLTPLVYSTPVVEALRDHARRADTRIAVHLEVDTGMNRVGLTPDQTVGFARRIASYDAITIEGVMTHFAAADDPDEDAFTRRQIARFEQVLSNLRAAGIDPAIVHAANTAAAWRFQDAHFDKVRVGLGLYGLSPSPAVGTQASATQCALEFRTRVIHLNAVDVGETVGYNRTWRAQRPSQIATIAVGYNDGFPRFMSNGGEVLIGGQRCPVVGQVCMDVSMVDVTALPEVAVGNAVVLIGRQGDECVSVDTIAQRGKTISYEILCNIGPRVRRIFMRR